MLRRSDALTIQTRRQRATRIGWHFGVVVVALACGACTRSASEVRLPARPDFSGLPASASIALAAAEEQVRASDTASAWLALGRIYHANGFSTPAKFCYGRVGERDSAAAEFSYLLADVARLEGDAEAEGRALADVVRLRPDYLPAQLWRADLLQKTGDAAGAAAIFEQVLKIDPVNEAAALGFARELQRRGDTVAVVALLENVVANPHASAATCALLAPLLEQAGDTARAAQLRFRARARKDPPAIDPWLRELRAACFRVEQLGRELEDWLNAGRTGEAGVILRRLEEVDAAHWSVRWYRARLLSLQGQHAEAAVACEQALAAGGDAATIFPQLVASLSRAGAGARAEEKARAGLKQLPRSADLWVALAELRLAAKDPADARASLAQALAVAPDHLTANRLMARLEGAAGDHTSAMARLEKVRRLDSTDLVVRAMLGQAQLEANRPALAVAPLAEALAIDPNQRDLARMLALAHLRVGNEQARSGDLAAAMAHYDDAIAADPSGLEAYANKAGLLVRQKQFDAAEKAFAPLLKVTPNSAEAHLVFGDILAAAGRDARARELWTRAAALVASGDASGLRAKIAARINGAGAPP